MASLEEQLESHTEAGKAVYDAIIGGGVEALANMRREYEFVLKAADTAKSTSGYTALHHAVKSCNEQAVIILLQGGINSDTQNKAGETALHMAAYTGQLKIVSLLLIAGSDPEIVNLDGETALHKAAMNALSEQVCIMLVEAGANIMCKNSDGWTPLHKAALLGNIDVAVALIKLGADAKKKDRKLMGKTPLNLAKNDSTYNAMCDAMAGIHPTPSSERKKISELKKAERLARKLSGGLAFADNLSVSGSIFSISTQGSISSQK